MEHQLREARNRILDLELENEHLRTSSNPNPAAPVMLSLSTMEQQLRDARKRVLALELENHALRTPSTHSKSPPLSPTSNRHSSNTRQPIMTRRATAAAAAAKAAATTSTTPTENTSDISEPSTHLPSDSPPEYSDISRDPSELSSSHQSFDAPSKSRPQSDSSTEQNTTTTTVNIPIVPIPQLVAAPVDLSQNRLELSSEVSIPLLSPPLVSRSTTPVTVASGKSTPSSPLSPTPAPSTAPRRRPPPLPVVKTTSTKKEKLHLVAKCTEPKPGQTRYWTDDEHERFLEAMAAYGEKQYVAISNYVETRTPKQVRTHAQKFQMKMAKLARQNIEAGQPIQMPAGMSPVIELPMGTKSTIVTITPDKSIKLASKTAQGISEIDPSILKALSASQMQQPPSRRKRDVSSNSQDELDKTKEASTQDASNVSDASSSVLTDPYLSYLGAGGETKEDGMELENTFAAKLSQTLRGAQDESESKDDGDFLMSDGSSDDATSSAKDDDDLEGLENLEDGDLSLAPFANPSDPWLLPDSNMTQC